ncbi:MAG: metallopeptidase TldD-related protein [Bryobacteraceae bacterium]
MSTLTADPTPRGGTQRLEETVVEAVRLARELGASGSEATAAEGEEFSADVRLGEIERVKESGSRGVGIRVLFGKRIGSSYTSDFSPEGLRAMVAQAVDLARITTEDPFVGLPDPSQLGKLEGNLSIYYPDVPALSAADKIERARRAEKAALDHDPRITNSDGGSFGSHVSRQAFANSLGFCGSYQTTSCSLSVAPVAQFDGRMERDYWYTVSREAARLEDPESVGRKAAERVLLRLNPRKIETCKAAVIFEPRVARTLVGHVFELASGDAIYRKASSWHDRLGQTVAAPSLTVIDDATLPGLFGTSPFDDEGVPSRRTPVIENGVLENYLLNTYTGRKLGMPTTGNASRGLTGNAGVGHGNLFIEKGSASPEELMRQAGSGLLVMQLLGFGFNPVTGDYSRGATGLWFEDGRIAYPVSEVTIAGNFKDMLTNVAGLGNDLEFQGSVAAPTIWIREMTISGR